MKIIASILFIIALAFNIPAYAASSLPPSQPGVSLAVQNSWTGQQDFVSNISVAGGTSLLLNGNSDVHWRMAFGLTMFPTVLIDSANSEQLITDNSSTAAETLAKMLNESGDPKLISKLGRHFSQYLEGLNDIMPCQNQTQDKLFDMWAEKFTKSGKEIFGELMETHNIAYSFYENIISTRLKQAKELGKIWQKLS